jgi:hypothetical protein
MYISSSPYMPQALPISSSSMLSPFLTYRQISYLWNIHFILLC